MQGLKALSAILAALLFMAGEARGDSAPDWVKNALLSPPRADDKNVPYLILLDERATVVRETGRAETRSRYVVRVLTEEGRAAARREIQYDSQTKIADLHAWHVRADQKVFELEGSRVIEESITDDLYSEVRSKVVRFGEVDIGSVFAIEWVQREKPLVNQDYHFFQTRSPVVTSRYQLSLPEGWRVQSFIFNHKPFEPEVNGNTYTWQLNNLAPIKEEPWMPESTGFSPYLAVTYLPPAPAVTSGAFSSWQDVSQWADQLMRRPARSLLPVEAKARQLTSGLAGDIEKAGAISRWVQKNVRYVSIQLGVVGGYRPNPPDVVLARGYGDCKDKSSLMQAMLRTVGIESHLVLVFSGDPTRVRPEFPSPLQFNHAILAVAAPGRGPASLDHPQLGRLMLFDPTDVVTPLGDLPYYLQGSFGLLVNGGAGSLIKLPASGETDNCVRREMDVDVRPTGEIIAVIKETFTGQLASLARRRIASSSAEDYERDLGSRVARDIPGAALMDLKVNREADPAEPLSVEYTIKAGNYANRLGRLLVIRPILVWVQDYPVFTKTERVHPVLFDMKSSKEDLVRIKLPEGFRLDEIPSGTELKTGFAEFRMSCREEQGQVFVRRSLVTTALKVPVSQYGEIKKFFDAAQSASQSSIVFIGR